MGGLKEGLLTIPDKVAGPGVCLSTVCVGGGGGDLLDPPTQVSMHQPKNFPRPWGEGGLLATPAPTHQYMQYTRALVQQQSVQRPVQMLLAKMMSWMESFLAQLQQFPTVFAF